MMMSLYAVSLDTLDVCSLSSELIKIASYLEISSSYWYWYTTIIPDDGDDESYSIRHRTSTRTEIPERWNGCVRFQIMPSTSAASNKATVQETGGIRMASASRIWQIYFKSFPSWDRTQPDEYRICWVVQQQRQQNNKTPLRDGPTMKNKILSDIVSWKCAGRK